MAEIFKGYRQRMEAARFIKRYACPRFAEKDEKGNIVLGICYFVK